MKKTILLLLLLVISIKVKSQSSVNELLIKKEQIGNQIGSPLDFYTQEELNILYTYYKNQHINNHIADLKSNQNIPIAIGAESVTDMFGSFNVTSPISFMPKSPSVNEFSGAVDPNNPETAYTLNGDGTFSSLDIVSGMYTNLGTIEPPVGQWTGLEFDPTTNLLYAVTSGESSFLSIIDIENITSQPIGPIGFQNVIAVSIDGDGRCWAYNLTNDALLSIDLETGEGTFVGIIGFDANFGQGMGWDPISNQIYMSAFNNDTFAAEWRTVDTATGETTLIDEITPGITSAVGWVSIIDSEILSIDEENFLNFSFFPNPTKDVLNFNADLEIKNITITNLLGQKIISKMINSTRFSLDVSSLNNGTYLVNVFINNQIQTYKFIKE